MPQQHKNTISPTGRSERKPRTLDAVTKKLITHLFTQLDYHALGPIYCDGGGDAFWNNRRTPSQRLGMRIASHLSQRLVPKGRSLYVGAGVAELPMLTMETRALHRSVNAHNLRKDEVDTLNNSCADLPFTFRATPAQRAKGSFDHIWMVSVLNDPEVYPETSALSYGRVNPVHFDPERFTQERRTLLNLVNICLRKLTIPGLVTTSVEEIPWVTAWCLERNLPFRIENRTYPTAIVGDPVCFIHIGGNVSDMRKRRTPK